MKLTKHQNNYWTKIEIINLEDEYEKKSSFVNADLNLFIKDNEEKLKEEYINFSYLKITPNNLSGSNEFDEAFFKKIDEIENDISNGLKIDELSKKLKIKSTIKEKFIPNGNEDKIVNKIYQKRNENKIQLIDENEFYILFQIDKIDKILPTLDNLDFNNKIRNTLYEQKKYEYNRNIIERISNKKFNDIDFRKISNDKIEKIELKSINDDNKFSGESIKILYSLPVNSFTLVTDKENNIFLVKINRINTNNLFKNSDLTSEYFQKSNQNIKDELFDTFDSYIEKKYKIVVNQKSLERVKNSFK